MSCQRFILAVVLAVPLAPVHARSQFHFDSAAGRWTLTAAATGLEGARLGVDVDGRTLWPNRAAASPSQPEAVELRFGETPLVWTVRFRHSADLQALDIASTLRNPGDRAMRIGRVRLADATGPRSRLRLGPRTTALVMSGWGVLSRVRRLSGSPPQVSKTVTQLYDPETSAALNVGFTSFDRAETAIEMNWDPVRRTVVLSAWCDLAGYALQPGKSIDAETLRIALGHDPYTALDQWADLVQARYHPPIPPKSPAGWVGWAWVDPFHIERYEDVVRRNAEAVRRRLPGLDLDYIWVSLGNLAGRIPGNWLHWNYDSFPSGPEKLVADLGSLHFKLGLWAGVFWMNEQLTADVERLRDAFLLYKGQPIVVPHKMLGRMYVPDPTHPKTQDFLREVFSTYRKWGVRWYMIDFLYAATGATPGRFPNDGYYDRSVIQGPQAWREGLRTIREAVGDDSYLLAATGPSFQCIGWMNAIRAGSDYGDGRPLDGPGKGFYPATFVINKPDFWTSHREGTDPLANSFFTNRKLFLNDSASVMTIDQPIAVSDAQITTTIFGINGAPMMIGDDVSRMSDERLEMVKRVFPRLTEAARPMDLFEAAEPDYPKLFHLKIRRAWETWDLLACFNYGQNTLSRKIDLRRLGLDAAAGYVVWDFWNQRYLGVQHGSLAFDVAPFSVRLLRIAREQSHPWLLSTDLHVRQGQAEIEACRWNPQTATLTIRATRPDGYKGSLFLRAPEGWALADPRGLWIAKDGNDQSLIVRRAVEFTSQPMDVRLTFKRFDLPK